VAIGITSLNAAAPDSIASVAKRDGRARRSGRRARFLSTADSVIGQWRLAPRFWTTGFIGQHAQASFDRLPVLASRASGKIKINEESSRLLIVPDDIAHEDIEHVIIDWHRSLETRHRPYSASYTDKRTTLFAAEGSLTLDADEWRVLGFRHD
jgi:hypothetical protein